MTGATKTAGNVPILFGDRRYKKAEDQGFSTFEEGENFLRTYCNQCRAEERCSANKYLRECMGENAPCWAKYFVKLTLRDDVEAVNDEDLVDFVACRRFKPK